MSSSYHYGDEVTQYGDHNVGMVKGQTPADPQVALREMMDAVRILQGQVSVADRQAIDEAMDTISAGDTSNRQSWRRALGEIAGIATLVGQVGAPVVESVRKVMAAFGI
jgi:hypothetical protein